MKFHFIHQNCGDKVIFRAKELAVNLIDKEFEKKEAQGTARR